MIREEYSNTVKESYHAIQSLASRKQQLGQMSKEKSLTQEYLDNFKKEEISVKAQEDKLHMKLQKDRLLGDLMQEMKEYDKASMSTVMVERMEKVIASSLAQKDQIIMAQRLAELEAEKRHQEEINRIREE